MNQHHCIEPSNTISSQHGSLVENNHSDVVFSLVFSNGNWIALQQLSNNFTWLKICMLTVGLGLRLHEHQSNKQNLKGLLD
jgi:hypothetical protein